MKKRLIQFSADKTFNTSIEYDEKSQRWRAEKNYTEVDFFLTEDQAQTWIQEKAGSKKQDVSVSEPAPTQAPAQKPQKNILPPPPKPQMPKTSEVELPIDHDNNPKVSLPIAKIKSRLVKGTE